MLMANVNLKQQVVQELEKLPPTDIATVLDFVLFLQTGEVRRPRSRNFPSTTASRLDQWTGLVAWGGNAVEDAERLYDGSL